MHNRRAPRSVRITVLVAALVAVVALGAVLLMRVQADRAEADRSVPEGQVAVDAAARCGDQPCEVLTSLPVHGETVELLTDVQGKHGKLRIFGGGTSTVIETAFGPLGVRLDQSSLACVAASTSACLVFGEERDGVAGQLVINRGEGWRAVEEPYFSDAGYVGLAQVSDDDAAELLVLKCVRECAAGVLVEVYALDGSGTGCTVTYGSKDQVPGWPDVKVAEDDLRPCD